jgi:hypothetical protein
MRGCCEPAPEGRHTIAMTHYGALELCFAPPGLDRREGPFPRACAPWPTIFRAYGAVRGEKCRSTALFEQEFSYGGVFREADGLVKSVRSLSSFSKLSQEVGANRPVWLVLRYFF